MKSLISVRTIMPVRLLIFLLIIFIIPFSLVARGSQESELKYESLVEATYTRVIAAVAAGEMSSQEAKDELALLRDRYNISYNDEAGIMESYIDGVEEDRISVEEAAYYFTLLQNGELMEFRQEQEQEQAQEQAGNVADKFQYRPENAGSLTAEPINGSQPESSSPFAPSTDPEQGTEPEEPHGPESTPEQGPRI